MITATKTTATILMLSLFLPLLSFTLFLTVKQEQQSSFALSMTGQQYFGNGTGIAYYDDGRTEKFVHTIAENYGYYFDNKTNFYVGYVPGLGNNTDAVSCTDYYPDTIAGMKGATL